MVGIDGDGARGGWRMRRREGGKERVTTRSFRSDGTTDSPKVVDYCHTSSSHNALV
jgi:hypothetical protein